ncbi:hypothetical protein SUGI_0856480 [Cryptomeria japonica]|nr:hypothetical protein SUGI_0856480 [Cryptomeria japonica]
MADDWIAVDKLLHFLMCFVIATVSAFTIRLTLNHTKILHRWAVCVGCILALTAGAAKEVADEMGIWPSAVLLCCTHLLIVCIQIGLRSAGSQPINYFNWRRVQAQHGAVEG